MNKTTRSEKAHKGGQPRAARAPVAKSRPAAAAKRFRAPRLSRAASELLRRYFAMPAAQAAGDAG